MSEKEIKNVTYLTKGGRLVTLPENNELVIKNLANGSYTVAPVAAEVKTPVAQVKTN